MRSSHKLTLRRVGSTCNGRLREREPRVFAWSARYSALNCSVAAVLRPLFQLVPRKKHYDRGKERVTGVPARLRLSQEVGGTFIALNFLSTNIYSRTLAKFFQAKKLPRF